MRLINIAGSTFGRWTVLHKTTPPRKSNASWWLCRCVCGTTRTVNGQSLRRGDTSSCGCFVGIQDDVPSAIWRPVAEGGYSYSVSDKGHVRNDNPWRILKPSLGSSGYLQVELFINGVGRNFLVHRLILAAFVPPPSAKHQVNHKNGIRSDNRLENLEWATCSQNHLHSFRVLGRKPSGVAACR